MRTSERQVVIDGEKTFLVRSLSARAMAEDSPLAGPSLDPAERKQRPAPVSAERTRPAPTLPASSPEPQPAGPGRTALHEQRRR